MNKSELVSAVTKKLLEENKAKKMHAQRHKFYISDPDGNCAEFEIKRKLRSIPFTNKDVESILDAILDVTEESIRCGDGVSIQGFGNLCLHKRAARRTKKPGTNEWVEIEERLVPKFFFGNRLRMAARAFELIKEDSDTDAFPLPDPIYDFGEE